MRELKIIINEMKKLFNLKMICLLFLGSIIFYELFISFEIDYFPNGRPNLDVYNVTVQMLHDYGKEMDEVEFEQFKNQYEEKIRQTDDFLSQNVDFNNVSIYSYEDYIRVEEQSFFEQRNEAFETMKWDYLNRKEGTCFWELQTMEWIISTYEGRDNYYFEGLNEQKFNKRVNEIIEHNANESILPSTIFNNYNDFIMYVGVCIAVGIMFMLTPLYLKDRTGKVEYLQYSSKHGRRLCKSKVIAGLMSAFIITTVELLIYFIVYRGNQTSMFMESNINSALNHSFWFDLTFFQYIVCTVISIYMISIFVALISMFVSRKVNSYVTGIGALVPTVFIVCGLTAGVLLNFIFSIYWPKYLVFGIYVVFLVITVPCMVWMLRKERVIDIKG